MKVKEMLVDMDFIMSNYLGFTIRERAYCKDGFNISIQKSSTHYCRNGEVELGFPSEKVEELEMYAENWDIPTKTVYGYVPLSLIEAIVATHGGIDKELSMKNRRKLC